MERGFSHLNWVLVLSRSIRLGAALLLVGSSGMAGPRVWTNPQGWEMTATLIGVDGAITTVNRDGGRLFDVPVDRLSGADLACVRKWLERNDDREVIRAYNRRGVRIVAES